MGKKTSSIILPPKKKKTFDPYLAPIPGNRGTCGLCGKYSDLTETHVLPQAAGNRGLFLAESFIASVSKNEGEFTKRRFPNGISFRTLCASCNNRLGTHEDRAIANFFGAVKRNIFSKVKYVPVGQTYLTSPNLLVRGVLAHLLSANDAGQPSKFDDIVRDVFFNKLDIKKIPYNVYYWPYRGKQLTIVRDVVILEKFGQKKLPDLIYLLKLKPLAFLVTTSSEFRGLHCLNDYVTAHETLLREIPLNLSHAESNPWWPATTGEQGMMLTGGEASGLVATPGWRS